MIGYFELFVDKRDTELRSLTLLTPGDNPWDLPVGQYVFLEYYCDDLSCDCQRVLIKVFHTPHPAARSREVATISYTWHENIDAGWREALQDTPNPFLDPLHPKAPFADAVLDMWLCMLHNDQDYNDRLQRHYVEVRRKCGIPGGNFPKEELKAAIAVAAVELAASRTTPAERKNRHAQARQLMLRRAKRK